MWKGIVIMAKTLKEKIADLRKTIINCIPGEPSETHGYWKEKTIEQLDELLRLVREDAVESYIKLVDFEKSLENPV